MAELENKPDMKPAKPQKVEKPAKKKKSGIFAKLGKFLKDCRNELKKVVWYGKKQTVNSTILVVITLVFFAAVIGLLDYLFSTGITLLGNIY